VSKHIHIHLHDAGRSKPWLTSAYPTEIEGDVYETKGGYTLIKGTGIFAGHYAVRERGQQISRSADFEQIKRFFRLKTDF
jgi:hypothetical protein